MSAVDIPIASIPPPDHIPGCILMVITGHLKKGKEALAQHQSANEWHREPSPWFMKDEGGKQEESGDDGNDIQNLSHHVDRVGQSGRVLLSVHPDNQ